MQYNIINVGENPQELKYKFVKNGRTKSKMIISGFTQVSSEEKSYIADIPAMTLYFDNIITEINNGVAIKSIKVYDIKDSIKTIDNNKNLEDILKLNINLKLSDKNECLDVDITGINKDNKTITNIAESLKYQYQQMRKFPDECMGKGGSWSLFYTDEFYEYTLLHTLKNINKFAIKYDCITNYFSNETNLLKKETKITKYKEIYGSSAVSVSLDIETGDAEVKSKNFSTVVSQLKDLNDQIMSSEQMIISTIKFDYDNLSQQTNINDILKNIKDDKISKLLN